MRALHVGNAPVNVLTLFKGIRNFTDVLSTTRCFFNASAMLLAWLAQRHSVTTLRATKTIIYGNSQLRLQKRFFYTYNNSRNPPKRDMFFHPNECKNETTNAELPDAKKKQPFITCFPHIFNVVGSLFFIIVFFGEAGCHLSKILPEHYSIISPWHEIFHIWNERVRGFTSQTASKSWSEICLRHHWNVAQYFATLPVHRWIKRVMVWHPQGHRRIGRPKISLG